MNMKKLLKYFASNKGRTRTFHGVCFATIAMFGVTYFPQTALISKLKEVMQAYRNGSERNVSDALKKRFDIAIDKCKCTSFEKNYLKPFVVVGFDTQQIGTVKSRFFGYVGIPVNYFYNSIQDINRGDIQLRSEQIKWSSPDGQLLQEALILTEEEQIFGMARSVLYLKTHHVLLQSLFGPISLGLAYGGGNYFNQKLNLFAKPLGVRLILYSIFGLFGIGIYSFMTDYTQIQYDTYVDNELAQMGPEFIKAGIGFYEKLLKKNIAVRNMLNNNEYTSQGNEKSLIRQKSMPLTLRKKFFEMKLQELNAGIKSDENIPLTGGLLAG